MKYMGINIDDYNDYKVCNEAIKLFEHGFKYNLFWNSF